MVGCSALSDSPFLDTKLKFDKINQPYCLTHQINQFDVILLLISLHDENVLRAIAIFLVKSVQSILPWFIKSLQSLLIFIYIVGILMYIIPPKEHR